MNHKHWRLRAAMPAFLLLAVMALLAPGGLARAEGLPAKPFPTAPPAALLDAQGFQAYQASLAAGQCDAAASRLNRAFVARYPQHFRASEALGDVFPHFHTWLHITVRATAPGLALCRIGSQLNRLEQVIKTRGLPVGRYTPGHKRGSKSANEDFWQKRDGLIRKLIFLALKGHAPACLRLADVLKRKDVFPNSAEGEYYLRKRACVLGHGCAQSRQRMAQLAAGLPPVRQTALDEQAQQKGYLLCLMTLCEEGQ